MSEEGVVAIDPVSAYDIKNLLRRGVINQTDTEYAPVHDLCHVRYP